jgi:hypothetical protein
MLTIPIKDQQLYTSLRISLSRERGRTEFGGTSAFIGYKEKETSRRLRKKTER